MADGVGLELIWADLPKSNQGKVWAVDRTSIRETATNRPPVVIPFDEIARVRLTGRYVSRLEITARDGRSISCRFAGLKPELHAVLDAIASRIPHTATLEASPAARRAERNRAVLGRGIAVTIASLIGTMVAYMFLSLQAPPVFLVLVIQFLFVFIYLVAVAYRSLIRKTSNEPRLLTRTGWVRLHRGKLPEPSWAVSSEMRYIPDEAGERLSLVPALVQLGFCICFPTLFVAQGMPLYFLWLLPILIAIILWQLAGWFRIRARRNDRFRITEDSIELTRKGRTIRAPLSSVVIRGKAINLLLLGQHALFTGPEGKIECDYRYLWPVDRPLYEPESPWEELWRVD